MLSLSEQALASQVPGGSKPRATSQLIPARNASSPALFSFLPSRQEVQLPLQPSAQSPAPSCWQVWTPQLPPDCPSTPFQRGRPISPGCRCSEEKKGPGFHSQGFHSHRLLPSEHSLTSSCFLNETTTKTSNKIMPVPNDVKGLSGAKGWPSYCPYPSRVDYIEKWGHSGRNRETPATQPFWLYLPSPLSSSVPLPLLPYLCTLT